MSAKETLMGIAWRRSMRYLLTDPEYMKAVDRKDEAENKLRESLTPDQLELFDQLLDADDKSEGLILTKAYIVGYGDGADMKQLQALAG